MFVHTCHGVRHSEQLFYLAKEKKETDEKAWMRRTDELRGHSLCHWLGDLTA
jgi:hypothetical protein